MRKTKARITVAEFFFFAAYLLYGASIFTAQLFGNDALEKGLQVLSLVASYVVMAKTIKRGKVVPFVLVVLLFVASLYLLTMTSRSGALVMLFTLFFAAREIKQKKIIKIDLMLKILLVLTVFAFDRLGLTQAKEFIRDGEVRNSLGFSHPNYAGAILMNVFLDIVYLYRNKKMNVMIGIVFFIVVMTVTGSRSASLGIAISCILRVLPLNKMLNTKKKIWACSIILVAFLSGLSILVAASPMTNNMKKLDDSLSGRVSISQAFYQYYGINLFGNEFEKYEIRSYEAKQFYVLDNAYLFLLIHNGIVVFSVFSLFYISRMADSLKQKREELFIALVSFAFVGLMEGALFSPNKNPFMILSDAEPKKENI